jgi:hypothetical protein
MKKLISLLIVIAFAASPQAQEAFFQLHINPELAFQKELPVGKDIEWENGENYGTAMGGEFLMYYGDYNGGAWAGLKMGTNFRGSGYQQAVGGLEFALNLLEEDKWHQLRVMPFIYGSLGANEVNGVYIGGKLAYQLFVEGFGYIQPSIVAEHDLVDHSQDNMNVYFRVTFALSGR